MADDDYLTSLMEETAELTQRLADMQARIRAHTLQVTGSFGAHLGEECVTVPTSEEES